ncbi:MAG: hypothetical protein WA864_10535 [Acetobacteraceae bacterium]
MKIDAIPLPEDRAARVSRRTEVPIADPIEEAQRDAVVLELVRTLKATVLIDRAAEGELTPDEVDALQEWRDLPFPSLDQIDEVLNKIYPGP